MTEKKISESVNNKDIYKSMPKDLKTDVDKLFEKYGIDEQIFEGSFFNMIEIMIRFFLDVLRDDKDANVIFDLLKYIYDNYQELAFNAQVADRNFYEEMKAKFEEAKEINDNIVVEIIESYLETMTNKVSLDILYNSILILRALLPNLLDSAISEPLEDFFEKTKNKFIELLEINKESEFKSYFLDWVLKFGYLIEGYIKEILIVYLKLCALCKDNTLEEYNRILKKEKKHILSLGAVLYELEKFETNIEKTLAKIRNSIFHTSFILDYKINVQERKIEFQDRNKKISIDIEEFINLFYYLEKIYKTFSILITPLINAPNFIDILSEEWEKGKQKSTK